MPTKIIVGCSEVAWDTLYRRQIPEMSPFIWGVKIGSETRDVSDTEKHRSLHSKILQECRSSMTPVMLDYKFAETLGALRHICQFVDLGSTSMITVSYDISEECLREIIRVCHIMGTKVLVVTVKTDMTEEECYRRFDRSVAKETFQRGIWAKLLGADGAIVPPATLKYTPVRDLFTARFVSGTPAIRWEGQDPGGHIDPMTPEEIAPYKPHYVVADSAIWNAPGMTPVEATEKMFRLFNT